jgi:predicted alpha/beta hydrolase
MFTVVTTVIQQIMTELKGAVSEVDRIIAIKKSYIQTHEAKWLLHFIGGKYDCAGETSSICKRQSRTFFIESAPYEHIRNCLTVIQIWSRAPDVCLTARQTGRLIIGRIIALTWTMSLESETVKYDHRSRGTRTRDWLRWREPEAVVNDRPVLS